MILERLKKNPSLSLILIFGLVSLLGDMIYEGARGVVGPYMASLGASAAIVGFVSGIGEFLGYGLRLISGYLTDKTNLLWTFTILGYLMIISIPLLGISNSWEIAAIFIILERIGKGIRTPARDVILSYATKEIGRGFGFGIHEAMDQIGAIIGPLLFGLFLYVGLGYKKGFLMLIFPCIFLLIVLFIAKHTVKDPKRLEKNLGDNKRKQDIPSIFWIYVVFSAISVIGFVNFQIISYHFKVQHILNDSFIPIIYAFAMGIDAIFALIIGRIYDKFGLKTVLIIPFINIFIPFFVFRKSINFLILGIIIWGMVMAMYETVMRASIADIIPIAKRGYSYGIFNTVFGLSYFLGSFVIGFLYTLNLDYVIIYILIMSVVSLLVGLKLIK
ncbi:MFS transporter [Desulfothermus naphthae]